MFYGHDLRSDLQEWRSRLFKCPFSNFQNEYRQFWKKVQQQAALTAIAQHAIDLCPVSKEKLMEYDEEIGNGESFDYESADEQAAILYQLHTGYWIGKDATQLAMMGGGSQLYDAKNAFLEEQLDPLINYLHDHLDSGNGILYLLEKYKRRTEWFKSAIVRRNYEANRSTGEQVLEDDLREYLFDQGIDYPFSQPASSSGRADIIGMIDTEEPLILEIKIWDSAKGYTQSRIASGFAQAVRYASDYNKPVGYLVVFNFDELEIHIETGQKDKTFPYRVEFLGKVFYIVIVNLNFDTSASKLKKLKTVTISLHELTVDAGAGS